MLFRRAYAGIHPNRSSRNRSRSIALPSDIIHWRVALPTTSVDLGMPFFCLKQPVNKRAHFDSITKMPVTHRWQVLKSLKDVCMTPTAFSNVSAKSVLFARNDFLPFEQP
ncbi:hypothetical protein Tcan_00693, partial [Toxocara canis]